MTEGYKLSVTLNIKQLIGVGSVIWNASKTREPGDQDHNLINQRKISTKQMSNKWAVRDPAVGSSMVLLKVWVCSGLAFKVWDVIIVVLQCFHWSPLVWLIKPQLVQSQTQTRPSKHASKTRMTQTIIDLHCLCHPGASIKSAEMRLFCPDGRMDGCSSGLMQEKTNKTNREYFPLMTVMLL